MLFCKLYPFTRLHGVVNRNTITWTQKALLLCNTWTCLVMSISWNWYSWSVIIITPTDAHEVQSVSKRLTHFVSLYDLNSKTAPQRTPDSWLRYSKFSARSVGWLAWATLKTLWNSSHILLWYTWSAGAFAFTRTACLFKLVIPTTNAPPRWRLNVETKTKRTLYSSR